MKILQAMAGSEHGGAENFFVRLAIALNRAGIEQKVVIRKNAERTSKLLAGGVEPEELPFGGRLDWRTGLGMKRIIKSFKPDIVLTWMNRATFKCPSGKKNSFVHMARLGGYYDLKYYRACDHLIGNTQDIVDFLVKENWPKEKAHYLPNFVSGDWGEPISRKTYFTPEGAPLILAMGRLHENKGFDVLLDALSRVPSAYLWLAGEGPLKEELETLAEKLGIKPRVRFLGWQDDIGALLQSCDLFVCPSRHEPLGNVVIEAWAQGKPVIATDSYGPGTLIEHLESGVLVPVDDSSLLTKAIRNVLGDHDLRERIGQQGYEAYASQFTEDIVTQRYIDFFKNILEQNSAAPGE
jgi:glycosyltransferase involved in cell wall biosynthesis